jgi:hypothetical protein
VAVLAWQSHLPIAPPSILLTSPIVPTFPSPADAVTPMASLRHFTIATYRRGRISGIGSGGLVTLDGHSVKGLCSAEIDGEHSMLLNRLRVRPHRHRQRGEPAAQSHMLAVRHQPPRRAGRRRAHRIRGGARGADNQLPGGRALISCRKEKPRMSTQRAPGPSRRS